MSFVREVPRAFLPRVCQVLSPGGLELRLDDGRADLVLEFLERRRAGGARPSRRTMW